MSAASAGVGTPVGDRVLVLPTPKKQEQGGIIIPDVAQGDSQEGTVVAVPVTEDGSVRTTRTRGAYVLPGDSVYYSKFAGSKLHLGGVEYLVMREDEILLVR